MGDAVDVDAAGGDVGGDQRADVAGAERRQHALAVVLRLVAVDGVGRNAGLSRPFTTLSAPCLVRVKTSARLTGSSLRSCARIAGLAAKSTWMMRWSMRSTVEATGVTATRAGSRSICVGEIGDVLRHGGREEQRLALDRQLGDDFADVVDEAHVEHAVGFVEHEELDLAELQRVALHEVEQAAGRGHHDFDALHHRADLTAHRHAADGERRGEADVAAIGVEAVEDLAGEFAGRARAPARGRSSAAA